MKDTVLCPGVCIYICSERCDRLSSFTWIMILLLIIMLGGVWVWIAYSMIISKRVTYYFVLGLRFFKHLETVTEISVGTSSHCLEQI